MRNDENKKYVKIAVTGVAVIVVSLLCFFLLYQLREVSEGLQTVARILAPFVYGAVIAYILAPACNRIEILLKKLIRFPERKPRLVQTLSIILVLLLAIALLWGLVMLVFPQVWGSIVNIANAIPGQLDATNTWLHDLLESQPDLQAYWDDISQRAATQLEKWLTTDLIPTVGTVINRLGSSVAIFFSILKNLFIGILISIYFLASRKQFAAQSRMVLYGGIPRKWAELIEQEVLYADKMFNGFLMGKLLDSAIIGVICFAATTILGFDSAALISVIVGMTNVIPFFGPFIGAIPCALLLLLSNPLHCLYFLIFIVVLQQLDGNVIGPKILGNTTGLSSFWVLFAILLFGGLWGIVGMVIGVPLFAVIYDIIRRLTFYGLHKHERIDLIEAYNAKFHPPIPKKKPAKSKRVKFQFKKRKFRK